MNRLQQELQRLYEPEAGGLIDAQGRVRAMVLELARPADWAALSVVWGGVQADLALPAPAIAVNGVDGYQLWFSVEAPITVAQAGAFLGALRRRYLGDIAPLRVTMLPMASTAADLPPKHAPPVPAAQANGDVWSAFVAQDLAPMFTAEPWLDMQPNPEGQAQLLASLSSIKPQEFEAAMQQLLSTLAATAPAPVAEASTAVNVALDPRRFLLDVMNNASLDWALRIEAAKALLSR